MSGSPLKPIGVFIDRNSGGRTFRDLIEAQGPGATNLVTGIADAYLDSVPLVAITGQVPTSFIGTDAFQEVDAFGVMMPVVRHSFKVMRPDKLGESLWLAFRLATTGRKGPVHLDLPKDVALAEVCCADRHFYFFESKAKTEGEFARAADLIEKAERPLLYAGGGIHQASAQRPFRQLVDHLEMPVVCTLKGLGAVSSNHPLLLGMMGMHGAPRANRALRDCDLLFAIGARFDDRATGKLNEFCPNAKIVHFDIDTAEIGKLRAPDVAVTGCLSDTLPELLRVVRPGNYWSPETPDALTEWDVDSLCPRDILQAIDADIITTDVGQHQMWAAQFLNFKEDTLFLTSGGLGTMGFGLPAAIGAQFARPNAKVVCVTGDGSLMMMIHELATLRRYNVPVKIVLFDNSCLGLVRQWQEVFHDNRESEIDLSDNPDFCELATAFGIPSRRLTRNADVADAVREAFSSDGPFLLHCLIERQANVWPLVPPGKANHEFIEACP